MPVLTVDQLAKLVRGAAIGDTSRILTACNTLMDATPEQCSLLHNAKYAKELETTKAGCVILPPGTLAGVRRVQDAPPLTVIEAKDTYYAWQQAMVALMGQRPHPKVAGTPDGVGTSPLASVHPSATLGKNVSVHPFAVVGENVSIGDNTIIYSHVTITQNTRIGNDCVIYPRVTIYEDCTIGNRCLINAGTVIGSDGFAYAQANGIHHKMPQLGSLIIEDDVEIGSDSIVERGALNPTRVERGTKIGSHVIIGHNCRIGIGNLIISGTCVSGSTTTGKYVVMGGQVGIAGHLDIPDFVKIGAQSGVMANPEPNTEIVGTPAMEGGHAKRVVLNLMRLPELAQRIKELEKKLARIDVTGK